MSLDRRNLIGTVLATGRAKGIAVESHFFAHGGHGFGLRKAIGKPVGIWPDLFVNWAHSVGLA